MLFNPVEYLLRGVAVSLNLPNTSRSYNPAHRSITFWASDRALEVTFEVDNSALAMMNPNARTEEDFLEAFDNNRKRIEDAAERAYKMNTLSFHILTKDSF